MKVAIVGSGVSGLVCASRLHPRHEVTVFEQSDWIGGHTHTVDVEIEGRSYAIDTGFIVYNERNYPNFCALLAELDVATQPTQMTFGYRSERTGLEYSGGSLASLFAQRSNVFRPAFWGMLAETLRFFREASAMLSRDEQPGSLGAFLEKHKFSRAFQDDHLLPMGAAIWSCPPEQMLMFPAQSFAKFFENHGLLRLRDRPEWRVVKGGSARYVDALVAPFRERIQLGTVVARIARSAHEVQLGFGDGRGETFDAVVLACHSDQALSVLCDPLPDEKEVLSRVRYQPNDVVLHTDLSLLPRSPRAHAAWNYHVPNEPQAAATVTYDMNFLQRIDAPVRFLVTLNSTQNIDPACVLGRYRYDHPVFDQAAIDAQQAQVGLGETLRTAYCGAYWGYGFHEDGVRSGIVAAQQLERMAR